MEELRRAAVAYYNNSSPEMQALSWNFFQSMDSNGDGRVSFAEFSHFIKWNGYDWVDRDIFPRLDANGDGLLDFWEVLTLYYIIKTRGVWCGQCQVQLQALYFTCVECFDAGTAFDLCSICYSSRGFRHHHRGLFLDSFVLLRSKIGVSPGTALEQAITQPQHGSQLFKNYWFKALEIALAVGNVAASVASCSIM